MHFTCTVQFTNIQDSHKRLKYYFLNEKSKTKIILNKVEKRPSLYRNQYQRFKPEMTQGQQTKDEI